MNKKVMTVLEKPEWIKEQEQAGRTVIHNATRPLYGDKTEDTWSMPFLCGRHYAALDPHGSRYEDYCKLNRQLDATIIEWVNPEEAYSLGWEFYRQYYGDKLPVDLADSDYRQHIIETGLAVMNGFETLEDY